jgi:genome maintenance exonuclease 1
VEANRVSTQALSKGNDVHEMIERHILGEEQTKMMPNVKALFAGLRDVADARINNVRMVEGQLFSHHLEVAGTVDLVAEFDGRLSIIDWKTSSKEKPRKFINNYFKQESAYAVMFEERTKIPVDQLVTIITHPEGTQVFVEHRDNWIEGFMELRKLYAEEQGRLE